MQAWFHVQAGMAELGWSDVGFHTSAGCKFHLSQQCANLAALVCNVSSLGAGRVLTPGG
jgi:hypothetical protein